ncbi:unnamed protein product [Pedinophyceae sp. YPF-701]|nr:unnamed protein product [Pedinophyceae sp. YPF-701]
MRVVVQRVKHAAVEIDGEIVSRIGPGLLCLVGISASDGDKDSETIARKLLGMRIWQNPESGRPWDQSAPQMGYELLMVSNFTLYGRLKGNKCDFSRSKGPAEAKEVYEGLVERVRKAYSPDRVKDGVFGAMMGVSLENDGPVTVLVETSDGALIDNSGYVSSS